MAKINMDEQSAPTTPTTGQHVIWPDNTTSMLSGKTDGGRSYSVHQRTVDAFLLADQTTVAGTDTYVTGSGIQIPSFGVHAGMQFVWNIGVTKTAAGVAASVVTLRTGATKTVTDTSRLALTATTVQTAAIATGILIVVATVRSVGAAGTLNAAYSVAGPAALGGGHAATSAGFDTTTALAAGQYIGLSISPGAAGIWTFSNVNARLEG